MKKPKVSIIILNWNQHDDTAECLRSIRLIDYGNYEVIVVDNGSEDGSEKRIKKEFPEIKLVKNNENLGFTGGNNRGIGLAMGKGADYVLLLNNDTIVKKDFLSRLVQAAESDRNIGIVGPKIYYFDDPKKVWFTGGKIDWNRGKVSIVDEKKDSRMSEKGIVVDYVGGCAMLIKREVINKIGALDERFFIYFEETDMSIRIKKAGYKVVYLPLAQIWHKVSRKMGKESPSTLYYYTRNRPLFIRKNGTLHNKIVFYPYYIYEFVITPFVYQSVVKMDLKKAMAIAKGFYDFLTGNFGKARWIL
ncbi:glycosyl transferase [Candidatus Woesearchaeota archaeon CG10_big_fil_rev_8_21_14_0_10_44_13]|nr:MAG: glycosyl transferase [Candidatus Woesearchaeota archaeon CG10_big_fil_rev_8_21_14_0_10_44_13]